ncbi:hypothetical protein [Saliphagus sp. LR7]|uniref:polysaccharide deacetylase family protein n=1 Tax=Saliphagus sp. LR7 TaxID=2282654 RepID=UPI000DF7F0C9|nr:hypothetical protein [Saliphagus sp. LR7]
MTDRRSFLAAAGTTGALSLAGCLSDDILGGNGNDTEDEGEEATENGTDEDQRNETSGTGDQEGTETEENETGDDERGENNQSGDDDQTSDDEGNESNQTGNDEDEGEGGADDELADLPGESVDDFEDVDAWSPIVGDDAIEAETEEVYAGSSSARITAPESEEEATVFRTFTDGLDLSGQGLSLAIRYTGREQFDLTVQLLASDTRNRIDLRRVLTGAADRWQRVDLGVDVIEGDPDLADVREIRIVGRRRGDEGGEIEFAVDDLRRADSPDQGAVMLLFDGGLESHFTTAFEVLEEFDVQGVEAVTPEALGNEGRLTIENLEEMSGAGWDVISRPRTGSQFLGEYTPEQQEGLIRRSKGFLENRGFEDGARHFLTPRNLLSPESHDLIREYHEQAFRFGGEPNSLPITDHHNLGFLSGDEENAAATNLDQAAAYNQLAILHFVYVDDADEGVDRGYIEDVLEYIDDQDLQVVTASDLLDSGQGQLTGGSGNGGNESANETGDGTNESDNETGGNES